jgi:hypothetical protein
MPNKGKEEFSSSHLMAKIEKKTGLTFESGI